jgi:deoxyxylulose-5-phosphate synthase
VNELLGTLRKAVKTLNLGIPDTFIEHGDHQQQLAACGLDTHGIVEAIGVVKDSMAGTTADPHGERQMNAWNTLV